MTQNTMTQKILMIVSNPAVSTTMGWPVGFWAAELIHPYDVFIKAGFSVTIASPEGGKVEFDALSDPRDTSGYSKDDVLSMEYIQKADFMSLLDDTPAIATLSSDAFDAIVICGGQGPMFTFRDNTALADFFMEFYRANKPSAALCHGTCLLLDTKLDNGDYLIKGKAMTGFANSEEDLADQAVGQTMMPFRIEDEARSLGANFITSEPFSVYAVQDGHLITGQQQNSGAKTAELVLAALGRNL